MQIRTVQIKDMPHSGFVSVAEKANMVSSFSKKAKPFPVIIIVVVLLEKKISVLISIRCKQAHKTVV